MKIRYILKSSRTGKVLKKKKNREGSGSFNENMIYLHNTQSKMKKRKRNAFINALAQSVTACVDCFKISLTMHHS